MLAEGAPFERIRDYAGWTINAAKAMGVKVVNPAGISAFKFNQRKLDVDEGHVRWQVTPRQVVHTLARALRDLGVPHPLHIHGSNLGVAGNIESTLQTIDALEGLPAHLTHIQFHAYGREGPKKFSSAAQQLAEAVNANPNISIVSPDAVTVWPNMIWPTSMLTLGLALTASASCSAADENFFGPSRP